MNASVFLLAPPLVACGLAIVVKPYRRLVGWLSIGGAAISLMAALSTAAAIVSSGAVAPAETGVGLLRVDALSALLALAIAFVTLLASAFGPGLGSGDDDPVQSRR